MCSSIEGSFACIILLCIVCSAFQSYSPWLHKVLELCLCALMSFHDPGKGFEVWKNCKLRHVKESVTHRAWIFRYANVRLLFHDYTIFGWTQGPIRYNYFAGTISWSVCQLLFTLALYLRFFRDKHSRLLCQNISDVGKKIYIRLNRRKKSASD